MFAHPRPALIASDPGRMVDAVAGLVDREEVGEVIVGLPLSLAGTETAQTAEARAVVRRLRQRLVVPVTEWDERLSSVQAGRSVHGRERRARGELDSAAAAIVLQAVLDHRRGGLES
jgi:putative Holliday junction resolvase